MKRARSRSPQTVSNARMSTVDTNTRGIERSERNRRPRQFDDFAVNLSSAHSPDSVAKRIDSRPPVIQAISLSTAQLPPNFQSGQIKSRPIVVPIVMANSNHSQLPVLASLAGPKIVQKSAPSTSKSNRSSRSIHADTQTKSSDRDRSGAAKSEVIAQADSAQVQRGTLANFRIDRAVADELWANFLETIAPDCSAENSSEMFTVSQLQSAWSSFAAWQLPISNVLAARACQSAATSRSFCMIDQTKSEAADWSLAPPVNVHADRDAEFSAVAALVNLRSYTVDNELSSNQVQDAKNKSRTDFRAGRTVRLPIRVYIRYHSNSNPADMLLPQQFDSNQFNPSDFAVRLHSAPQSPQALQVLCDRTILWIHKGSQLIIGVAHDRQAKLDQQFAQRAALESRLARCQLKLKKVQKLCTSKENQFAQISSDCVAAADKVRLIEAKIQKLRSDCDEIETYVNQTTAYYEQFPEMAWDPTAKATCDVHAPRIVGNNQLEEDRLMPDLLGARTEQSIASQLQANILRQLTSIQHDEMELEHEIADINSSIPPAEPQEVTDFGLESHILLLQVSMLDLLDALRTKPSAFDQDSLNRLFELITDLGRLFDRMGIHHGDSNQLAQHWQAYFQLNPIRQDPDSVDDADKVASTNSSLPGTNNLHSDTDLEWNVAEAVLLSQESNSFRAVVLRGRPTDIGCLYMSTSAMTSCIMQKSAGNSELFLDSNCQTPLLKVQAFIDPNLTRSLTSIPFLHDSQDELTTFLDNGGSHHYGIKVDDPAILEFDPAQYRSRPLKSYSPLLRLSPAEILKVTSEIDATIDPCCQICHLPCTFATSCKNNEFDEIIFRCGPCSYLWHANCWNECELGVLNSHLPSNFSRHCPDCMNRLFADRRSEYDIEVVSKSSCANDIDVHTAAQKADLNSNYHGEARDLSHQSAEHAPALNVNLISFSKWNDQFQPVAATGAVQSSDESSVNIGDCMLSFPMRTMRRPTTLRALFSALNIAEAEQYLKNFNVQGVELADLPFLMDQDFSALVPEIGPRRRLQAWIRFYYQAQVAEAI